MIDRQSITGTPEAGGQDSGYDGGKKVTGRKRHSVVDTLGYVRDAKVHAADQADTTLAPAVVTQICTRCVTLKSLFADAG
jgi:putative transposase